MKIIYINLDKDLSRNARMQHMLSTLGLNDSTERFSGVLATVALPGISTSETGCFQSHQHLLTNLSDHQSTIILEDDVRLTDDFGRKINKLIDKFDSSEMDLLFLGQTVLMQDVMLHSKLIKHLEKFESTKDYIILNASSYYRFATFAYAVNYKSKQKIERLFDSLDFTKNTQPIDNLLRIWIKQGLLKAGVIVPYLAGFDSISTSTMHDRKNLHIHRRHDELINLYCKDYSNNTQNEWREIIENQPNNRALEICKALYLTLTE